MSDKSWTWRVKKLEEGRLFTWKNPYLLVTFRLDSNDSLDPKLVPEITVAVPLDTYDEEHAIKVARAFLARRLREFASLTDPWHMEDEELRQLRGDQKSEAP